MPIIDEVTYDDKEDKTRKKTAIQYYRKKKVGENIRKMLRSENSAIRPRKIHDSWIQHPVKVSSVFKFSDYRESHDLPPMSLEPYNAHKKKKPESTTKTLTKTAFHHFENYCGNSTLHGLRYVGDNSLSWGERAFWFLAFSSALIFAVYYISKIFEKWDTNPVLIAFNPTDASFNQIPFPAITICNMNQAKKVEALRILKENNTMEKQLLYDYCNNVNNNSETNGTGPAWPTVQNFLIKVGQSCSDTLKSCIWKSDKINCEEFFNNDLTDEGLCCSFNRLPPENIFRNPDDIAYLNHSYPKKVYDWSPEKGFIDDNNGDMSTIPYRPTGAGTHLGLTVVVDAQLDNYYCSSTNSIGFKIILSNPIETPKIADFGFLVSPGVEARYVIKPEIRQATNALRGISVEKRQCYFQNERPLRYFRSYTKRNCRLECQSNHTLHKCNCIPYYLPKSRKVKVCGKRDEKCAFDAKEDMELVYGNGSSCNCLPSCFELNFDKSATYSKLLSMGTLSQIENVTDEYFRKNMAVLHFFFKETKFRQQMKSEIYGFTEVLSNVGGLLGLCLGFSILSLVEIGYFLTLRVVCGYVHSRKKQQKKNETENFSRSIIPFVR